MIVSGLHKWLVSLPRRLERLDPSANIGALAPKDEEEECCCLEKHRGCWIELKQMIVFFGWVFLSDEFKSGRLVTPL